MRLRKHATVIVETVVATIAIALRASAIVSSQL
jgi:hypothetical protein